MLNSISEIENLEKLLGEIRRSLLKYDPGILEIVQFGSSVYAPEHARDVDLLVITRDVKNYTRYIDAANEEDLPFDVDIVVSDAGKPPKEGILRNVLGSFKVVYGDGRRLSAYAKTLSDPTFEEAKSSLRVASTLKDTGLKTENRLDRDRLIREASDALFHAARIASMVYLSTEVTRWGQVKRRLPKPYGKMFDKFIRTLHIKYFYNGEYPRERLEEEFDDWLKKVENYVHKLELKVATKR